MASTEGLVGKWGLRVIFSIILGFIDAAFFYVAFGVLLPSIIEQLYMQLGLTPPPTPAPGSRILLITAITGVFIMARILAGTPLSPVFRTAGILLSLNLAIAASGGELAISVSGIDVGEGVQLDFQLDLTPLYAGIILFIVFPSILGSFIDYYLGEASR
ncbi:MAG: hypothetical protein F7B17_05650 [Desulfurococcales archaeon]|nr:hypothetical protein [Desulfurococcales archaeon]